MQMTAVTPQGSLHIGSSVMGFMTVLMGVMSKIVVSVASIQI